MLPGIFIQYQEFNRYYPVVYIGTRMKKIIVGTIVIVFGLLISLGPQSIFKVCEPTMSSSGDIYDCCAEPEVSSCCAPAASNLPICHWTARAEIGIGLLIAALGACMIVFTDPKTRLGLIIGVFMSSIIAFAIPNLLIGGCSVLTMRCRRVAFPAITAESVFLLAFSVKILIITALQKPVAETIDKN